MAYRALALAAAVRVVVGVHDGTAHGGTGAEVTGFARLAEVHNLVLEVAYLAHGSLAFYGDEPHFARGHFEGCVCALFCHYLGGDACGPRYLRAAAGLTQQQLADLVRVSSRTIISIEKEQYSPSLMLAYRMAEVFGVSVEELCCLRENKELEDKQYEDL